MTPDDLERLRIPSSRWPPDMRCADCRGSPSCPELVDELWRAVWGMQEPLAPARCNCTDWNRWPRLVHRVPIGAEMAQTHWHLCDLARPSRRPLLCLECVERRLRRAIVLADLKPCLGNYHVAVVMLSRTS